MTAENRAAIESLTTARMCGNLAAELARLADTVEARGGDESPETSGLNRASSLHLDNACPRRNQIFDLL
jgi:hypothetical protein